MSSSPKQKCLTPTAPPYDCPLFIYESEKPRSEGHNKLLTEIQKGVQLKKVQCNDRSKPILEGLRKFRRQLTIEEQIQMADEEVPVELDELDDIDKVRDDLQSTKQMLALELKNKEHLAKDNRSLQLKILNMEEEINKLKNQINVMSKEQEDLREKLKVHESKVRKGSAGLQKSASDVSLEGLDEVEEEMNTLKGQAELARKSSEQWETKFKEASKELVLAKANCEDATHKALVLEKKLKNVQNSKGVSSTDMSDIGTQTDEIAYEGLMRDPSKKDARNKQNAEDEEDEETEEEDTEEEDGEDNDAMEERRLARETKMLESKLKNLKDKTVLAKNERKALKEQHNKFQKKLKEDRKAYRKLQKEVDKMGRMLKLDSSAALVGAGADDDEDGEDDDENDDESDEEDEETEDEESSDESDTEDEEKAINLAPQTQRNFLQGQIKKRENAFNALKKGNYLLKVNIDRFKDDIENEKERYLTLQEDLNSVLGELG